MKHSILPPSFAKDTLPGSPKKPRFGWSVGLFDTTILIFLGVWLFKGIPFKGHTYLSHGADPRRAAILMGVCGFFLSRQLREKSIFIDLSLRVGRALTKSWLRWLVYLLFFSAAVALAIVQTQALRVTLYDVGIFHQVLWNLAHGFGFGSTLSGAGNFLLDHFSPSLVLLVPLFQIAQDSPLFLPIIHTVLIFLGGAAWIYFAARVPNVEKELRSQLAAATMVFILTFDSLWGNIRWGFHENVLAFCCLSWAYALLLIDVSWKNGIKNYFRRILIFILFAISALSKEILLLDVAFALGCWAFFEFKSSQPQSSSRVAQRSFGVLLLLTAILLMVSFTLFERAPHPPDKNYFNRYYSYLGQNLRDFFFNIIYSPESVLRAVGGGELLKYIFRVLSPWIFLPLWLPFWTGLRRKGLSSSLALVWGVSLLPSFFSAALATYPPLRSTDFHYVMELWPILALLTILGLSIRKSVTLIWIWALWSLLRLDHDPIHDFKEFQAEANRNAPVRAYLKQIPTQAAIVADEMAGTWVAGRRWITRWPDTRLLPGQCPDKIVVRYAEKGTLTELGVKSLISLCESPTHELKRNMDLEVSEPYWRVKHWSAYSINAKKNF